MGYSSHRRRARRHRYRHGGHGDAGLCNIHRHARRHEVTRGQARGRGHHGARPRTLGRLGLGCEDLGGAGHHGLLVGLGEGGAGGLEEPEGELALLDVLDAVLEALDVADLRRHFGRLFI